MSKSTEQEPKNKVPFKEKVSGLFGKIKSMWKQPPEGRFLTLKETGAFGVYALGVAFIYTAVNYVATAAFIPYFYRISSIHGYIILAVASFFNMLILPFLANKIEKTKSKWGRYKPYIIFSLPLYAVLSMLVLWIPQLGEESSRIAYAYLTCIPMLVVNGFFYNMYQTMPTIITSNTQERADIMTPLGLIFGFAPSLLQIVAGPIRGHFIEKGQEFMAMRIIGIISVVIGILCVLFIFKVKERVYYIPKEEGEEKVKFSDAMKMLSKNKPLLILTLALVLGSLREFTVQFRILMLQSRINIDVSSALDLSGVLMTIIGFAYTVAMLLLPLVTRKLDKKWIMVIFGLAMAIPNLVLGVIGYENIPIGTTSAVVITLCHFLMQVSPIYLVVPIMLGEVADYQQLKTGKRLDGHIQNLLFTVPLLASQLFMILTFFLQKQIGFEPSMLNDTVTIDGVLQIESGVQALACKWYDVVSYISAGSSILMVIVMLFYPLSRKKHEEVVEELKAISTITNVGGEEGFVEDHDAHHAEVVAEEEAKEAAEEAAEEATDEEVHECADGACTIDFSKKKAADTVEVEVEDVPVEVEEPVVEEKAEEPVVEEKVEEPKEEAPKKAPAKKSPAKKAEDGKQDKE